MGKIIRPDDMGTIMAEVYARLDALERSSKAAYLATHPTVTGSRGANAALTSLMAALVAYGLVTDSTTP